MGKVGFTLSAEGQCLGMTGSMCQRVPVTQSFTQKFLCLECVCMWEALMRCLSPFIQKCTHVFVHQLCKTQMLNGSESHEGEKGQESHIHGYALRLCKDKLHFSGNTEY